MASPTVKTWLNNAASRLQSHSYTPSEAELLLGFVLNLTKAAMLAHPEQVLTNEQAAQAEILLQRRLANEPIGYIIGRKDFYGRTFKVSPDVLIPRPDSEIIIDEAKKILEAKPTAAILDIGTGSGCLIITVALETGNKLSYTGIDISAEALNIATENASDLKANVTFLQSNLLNSLPVQPFDLIIANLPYLTGEQMSEPSIQSEPELALYGGTKGLHYYQQLLQQLPAFVTKGSVILLEIDPTQKHLLDENIKQAFPAATIEYLSDLNHKTRVVKITI
jgi:release factor glutamine methyltransferase